MNIITPKINLLQDISRQYISSLKSIQIVQKECDHLLNRLDFQFTLRINEKNRFITKVGISVREILLQDYKQLIEKIQKEYCKHEQMYIELMEQYRNLQQTIHDSQLAYEQLQRMKKNKVEEFSLIHLSNGKKQAELFTFNKENMNIQEFDLGINGKRYFEHKIDEKYQIKRDQASSNRSKIMLQKKQRKFQLINMQRKLNTLIDQCLSNLSNFTFTLSKKESFSKSIVQNQQRIQSFEQETIHNPSHGISLGLESINQEVNLLCTQDINDINFFNKPILQRITQREGQQSSSSSNSTPHKRLTNQTQ